VKTTFKDVGLEGPKKKYRNCRVLKTRKYTNLGGKIQRALLVSSWNREDSISKAVAGEAKCHFLSIRF
jgi:ATP-dependent Zn protease